MSTDVGKVYKADNRAVLAVISLFLVYLIFFGYAVYIDPIVQYKYILYTVAGVGFFFIIYMAKQFGPNLLEVYPDCFVIRNFLRHKQVHFSDVSEIGLFHEEEKHRRFTVKLTFVGLNFKENSKSRTVSIALKRRHGYDFKIPHYGWNAVELKDYLIEKHHQHLNPAEEEDLPIDPEPIDSP